VGGTSRPILFPGDAPGVPLLPKTLPGHKHGPRSAFEKLSLSLPLSAFDPRASLIGRLGWQRAFSVGWKFRNVTLWMGGIGKQTVVQDRRAGGTLSPPDSFSVRQETACELREVFLLHHRTFINRTRNWLNCVTHRLTKTENKHSIFFSVTSSQPYFTST
jgi:hypothetical protein